MKTITTNTDVYKFSELNEDAQQVAVEKLWDINVDHDWWDCIYEDANTIGLTITSFDLDRNRHCKGELKWNASEVCYLIIANHGEQCDTYKLAESFQLDYDKLVEKHSDGINTNIVAEDNEYDFDNEVDELEEDFIKDLLEEYAMMLQKDCDYLTSRDAIIETIESNDYDFTEDGKLF